MVPYINERDAVGLDTFKTSKLSQYFAVDTSCAYKNGRVNPSHLFELFRSFSGHEAIKVHEVLLEQIARNLNFHLECGMVCLEMRNTVFSDWVKWLADGRMYCDELGLLSLSALYHRDMLVVTSNKLWLTIEHPVPLNLLELLNECSIKLVYLGQLCFGKLKPHPRRPPRPIPIKNKDVTDEETVGQPTASPMKQVVNNAPASAECVETKDHDKLHVQTKNSEPHVETNDKSVHAETESKTQNVETDMAEQNSQHVETPTVLHVVTTDSTLPSNANAVVHAPTVDKVQPAT